MTSTEPTRPAYKLPDDVRETLDRQALLALWNDVTAGMTDDEKTTVMRLSTVVAVRRVERGLLERAARERVELVPRRASSWPPEGVPDHLWSAHCDEGCCL